MHLVNCHRNFHRNFFSEKKYTRAFSSAIANPKKSLALYVQCNGKTVGLLNAGVGTYYLSEEGKMATVYGVRARRREARKSVSSKIRGSLLGGKVGVKLIRMLTDWAKSQNATEIYIHATSGIEAKRTDKFLTRLGFVPYGGNYGGRVG